jgi:hypothetical protein
MAASEPSHIEGKFGWFLSHQAIRQYNHSRTHFLLDFYSFEIQQEVPALLQGGVLENISTF